MTKTFELPLKPRDKPVDMPEEYTKTLRNEYQARYLESIGATPTRANMALVRKHLPLEKCHFTAAWKSRGWMTDTLYISLEPPVTADKSEEPLGGSDGDGKAGTADPTLDAVWQQLQQAAEGPVEEEEEKDEDGMAAPRGNMKFDDARRAFLYPYKLLPAQLEKQQGAAAAAARKSRPSSGPSSAAAKAASMGSLSRAATSRSAYDDDGDAPAVSPYDFSSRDLHTYPRQEEEDLRAELQAQLRLHTKDIVALQAEFVQNFPFESLRQKLSAEQMRHVLQELNSRATARFIGLLALLLYWTHMGERAQRSVEEEQLGSLLCAVQTHFARVRERLKGKKTLMLALLPLLLLSVRMACEAIFRQAFPKWWTTVDARETLRTMDGFIEELFDPHRYHSHIAPLESSTEAIRIAAREELGVKYRARGARFLATSTLVTTAMPRGRLVAAHRQIAGAKLPPAAGQLAALTGPAGGRVQHELYQTALHLRDSAKRPPQPQPQPQHGGAAGAGGGGGGGVGGGVGGGGATRGSGGSTLERRAAAAATGSSRDLGASGSRAELAGTFGSTASERAIGRMIERPPPRKIGESTGLSPSPVRPPGSRR